MSRCTLAEALPLISALADVNAGRLTGRSLRYTDMFPIPSGTLADDAAQQLHASVYRHRGAPTTPDMIFYVVSSDRTPVAWLTYNATVHTPPATLSTYQVAHQRQAVLALSQLTRRAIHELARLRDLREGRTPGDPPRPLDRGGYLLVADPTDPTLTAWTQITADLAGSRVHLAAVAGTDAGILIVGTQGYGDYGRHRARFDLSIFCAIEHLATVHGLPPCVIGDWLHIEGASTNDLTAQHLIDTFTAAFAGTFPLRRAFAEAERDRRGWTLALNTSGIPLSFFDLDAFAADLFGTHARDIHLPDDGIAVFRRAGACT